MWRVVIASMLATFAVMMVPAIFGHPDPKPLFTDADLPPLPAPADNGWHLFSHAPNVREALAKLDPPPPLLPVLHPSADTPVTEALALARRNQAALGAFLDDKNNVLARAAFAAALALPRFADACPFVYDDLDCQSMVIRSAHGLMLFEALRSATAPSPAWTPALTLAARLLAADFEAAASARTAFSYTVALHDLDAAISVTASLVDGYRQARAADSASPTPAATSTPQLPAELIARLRALDGDLAPGGRMAIAVAPRRALIGEYVFGWRSINGLSAAVAPGLNETLSWIIFYDRARTLEILNERTTAVIKALEISAAPVTFPALGESRSSWLHNHEGKRIIDALDIGGIIPRWSKLAVEIEAQGAKLHEVLAPPL